LRGNSCKDRVEQLYNAHKEKNSYLNELEKSKIQLELQKSLEAEALRICNLRRVYDEHLTKITKTRDLQRFFRETYERKEEEFNKHRIHMANLEQACLKGSLLLLLRHL